jgi:SAM-dependent methyltransferase
MSDETGRAAGERFCGRGGGEQGNSKCRHREGVPRKGPLLEGVLHPAAVSMIRVACEELFPRGNASILELLAGPSNLSSWGDTPNAVTGLGAWKEELLRNNGLRHRVIADPNRAAALPFRSRCFDGAVLLFGVETLREPARVFEDVSRVLRRGAVFLIAFSAIANPACGNSKWERMNHEERLSAVVSDLEKTESFGPVTAYGTKRRVRSEASRKRHPPKSLPHVWIAYAKNRAAEPRGDISYGGLERTCEEGADPLRCPYCGDKLKKYEVPHSPCEIDYWYESEFLYICFNDLCPYFERGWGWMWSNMKRNVSYRHMYNPATGKSGPIPVPTVHALRDGIVEDG